MEDYSKKMQNVSSWDCGSPLYDSHELVSIIDQLDRGLATLYPSSTPPPDRRSCYSTSWISSHSQKLKRASSKYASRFGISSSGNGFDARKRVNKKHPLGWLFRLPWIGSHGVKSIVWWKVAIGECPSQDQIKEDACNGDQTREAGNPNGKLY